MQSSAFAQPELEISSDPITWNIIGLDSNDVTVGPNEFPVGIRVTNTGTADATNVMACIELTGGTGAAYVSIKDNECVTTPALAPGDTMDFYFTVEVERNPAAYFTTRDYQITLSADAPVDDQVTTGQLFVEKLLSQSRNAVLSLVGPPSVAAGECRTFILTSTTAPNGYEQLTTFVNFPNDFFQIESIMATYTAGGTNDKIYADACGWDPVTRECVGPENFPDGRAGGDITVVYEVCVLKDLEGPVHLTTLINDKSGSSYHYNADFGLDVLVVLPRETDLTVIKSDTKDPVEAGDDFEYLLTVMNLGDTTATDVVLTDTLPMGIEFLDALPPPVSGPDPLRWTFPELAVGGTTSVLVHVRAGCDVLGSVTNTAAVATVTTESSLANNETTEPTEIVDTTPPNIVCPDDISVGTDPRLCTAVVDYMTTATDGCPGEIDLVCVPASGSTFAEGVTTVTCTATDASGNDAVCTFTVTVTDDEAPVITCPPDAETTAAQCESTATVRLTRPTATDNCDLSPVISMAVRSDGLPIGDPFPLGMTFVSWTATDDAGNVTSCTTKVTVNENICPVPEVCVYTQGFWKNHPEEWPVDSLMLGSVTYTQAQLLAILNEPVRMNGLVLLARQLIAAKLNIAAGADPSTISATIAEADALIGTLVIPPIGDGFLLPSQVMELADMLAAYNEGLLGPEHCPDDRDMCLLECPEDITVNAEPEECGADVDYMTIISGFCPGTTVVCEPPPGSFFPVGVTTVICSVVALDDSRSTTGSLPQCSFTVTVIDNQRPDITCPANISVGTDEGRCDAVVNYEAMISDNCTSGLRVVCTPPSGTLFNAGTTTVTCTATDGSGNQTSCTFTVTVSDDEPPVIICPNDVETTTSGCDTSVSVMLTRPTATDNCDSSPTISPGVRSDSQPLSAPFPIGTTTVTWTATDDAGNMTSCTTAVTVNAGECPVPVCEIECPPNIQVGVDPMECGAVVSYEVETSGDCEGTTVICTPPSGSVFPVGTTLVTCRVTVLNGVNNGLAMRPHPADDECTFTVTVVDMVPPQITCPANISVGTFDSCCFAVVDYQTSVTDNCPSGVTLTCVPPSGSAFSIGTTTVTCTATDASGNTASCSFTVTVTDTEPPIIVCPPDVETTATGCETSVPVVLGRPVALDNCTSPVLISAAVRSDGRPLSAPFPIGETLILWTATDEEGNEATCSTTVRVNAGECPVPNPCPNPPVITCPSNIRVNTDSGRCDALVTYQVTATDDCTTNPTITCFPPSGTRFPIGTTTVFCVATDSSGQSDTCTFTVTVNERVAPLIVCPADITVNARPDCCDAIVNYTVTATDACDPNVRVVCMPPSGTAFPIGTTPVVCIATDASGNTARCTFLVTVRDGQGPNIICPPDMIVDTCPGCCEAQVDYVTTATDNCHNGLEIVCVPPPGSLFPLGVTRVVCTATDASGNQTSCSFIIDVCDHEPPVITCPGNVTVTAVGCATSARVSLSRPTATDNCTTAPLITRGVRSDNLGLNDPYPIGTTTITWAAVDPSGNVATCTSLVTVLPGNCVPCSIICPANITVNTDPGQAGALVTFSPTTTGNCNGTAITCVPASGTLFPIGTTTVTCTAVIPGNGTVQCSFTVTVVDNVAPVLTCPDDITVTAAQCQTSANVAVPLPTVSDNSGQTPTITSSRSDGLLLSDPFPAGTTVVTFTATDAAGNEATCLVQVTVVRGSCPQPPVGCTRTLGFWKNHPEAWPVSSLNLGNRTYSQTELLAILNQPVMGNRLVRLAHQLIAAKLNVAAGADPTAVSAAIAEADAMIGNLVVPPIGTGNLQAKLTANVHITLGRYNEGLIGPGSCPE